MDRFPSLRGTWNGLLAILRASLASAGLGSPEVFRMGWDGTQAEAEELARESGGTEGDAEALMALWVLTSGPAKAMISRDAYLSMPEAVVATSAAARKRELACADVPTSSKRPRVHTITDHRWPVNLRGRKDLEGNPQARAEAETRARSRALESLLALVQQAGLPVVSAFKGSGSADGLLEVIGHGRRARTIEKRVRAWKKAATFFSLSFGSPWPVEISQVLSWLRTLRDEGSWASLQCAWESLGFTERAGGVEEKDRFPVIRLPWL